jgi:hypothetical protein
MHSNQYLNSDEKLSNQYTYHGTMHLFANTMDPQTKRVEIQMPESD